MEIGGGAREVAAAGDCQEGANSIYFALHRPREWRVLAALGLLTILALLALIMSGRLSPLVALIVVPTTAALVGGFGFDTARFIVAGLQQTATVAAMFVFAILYFGVMTDAGLLDPIVDRILRAVGMHPTRIVVGSALLALLVHLDGSGAVTFLVTIPAMLPLFERLGMDKRILACVVSMAAGVNFCRGRGPPCALRRRCHLDDGRYSGRSIPVQLVGLTVVFAVAYMLGKREERRLGLSAATAPLASRRELTPEAQAMRRPGRFWMKDLVLTVVVMAVMIAGVVDPAVMFMARYGGGAADQLSRPPSSSALAWTRMPGGVDDGGHPARGGGVHWHLARLGHAGGHGRAAVGAVPRPWRRTCPFVLGLVSMPLSLLFDPDSFYLGALPVIAEVGQSLGVPPIQFGSGRAPRPDDRPAFP